MDFQTFTQQIARHLTNMISEWSAYNPDQERNPGGNIHRMIITDSNGSGIHVKPDGYNFEQSQRISITGVYPGYNGHTLVSCSDNCPRITCAISRGPEAIARDIERRFLPAYLALVEEINQRIEEYTRRNAAVQRHAERIALAFGLNADEIRADNRGALDSPILYVRSGEMSGTVGINGENSVNVELNWCAPDIVVAIGEAVSAYAEDNPETVECPRCGCTTTDATTVEDHGFCRDCLERWQWGEE